MVDPTMEAFVRDLRRIVSDSYKQLEALDRGLFRMYEYQVGVERREVTNENKAQLRQQIEELERLIRKAEAGSAPEAG